MTINNIEREPRVGISLTSEDLNPRKGCDSRIQLVGETRSLELAPGRTIQLSFDLSNNDQIMIESTLKDNTDLFAWSTTNLPVDPLVVVHRLSVFKEARYVSQKKRKLGEERRLTAKAEVAKLLEARFIGEVYYTTWLANVVLVKKPSGRWRMCIDYTNLNKAYPKDAYPLPIVDRLVDGVVGN